VCTPVTTSSEAALAAMPGIDRSDEEQEAMI
jgi:hypothetical protein